MKREDMTVGMEVEHRMMATGAWRPGVILEIKDYPDAEEGDQVVIVGQPKPYYSVWRSYGEIRLPGTAASKKTPES